MGPFAASMSDQIEAGGLFACQTGLTFTRL
jgi:hypothetical protein